MANSLRNNAVKTFLIFLLGAIPFNLFSQNWVKLKNGLGLVGDVYLYKDIERNDLYLYGLFFTDRDGKSLRGIAKWDGTDYIPIAGGGPMNPIVLEVVRYKNILYLSTWVGYDSTLTDFWHWAKYNESLNKLDTLSYGLVDAGTFTFKIYKDILYANGLFKKCGNENTWGICSFDGTTWKSLYNKPNIEDDNMACMAWYKNEMYVAGNFDETNNASEQVKFCGVLKDGDLKKIGSGFGGVGFTGISSMIVFNDELYIGGYFLEADGNPGNHLVRWDGNQFKSVGTLGPDYQVGDMVVHKNNLYVSGRFTYVDGIYSPKIARWDGTQWHAFNTDDIDLTVNDLEIYNDELYISGHFYTIEGDTFNHVAKYAHQLPDNDNPLEVWINNTNEQIIIQNENQMPYEINLNVYSVNGQCVKTETISGLQGYTHQQIPIPDLAAGVYIVEVTAGFNKVQRKLLKLDHL